ncbi:MAG: hypothetical protein FWF70_03460 [Bacteroidetes bacterium]|nr:hypothetical protein [Bacteroidota bacterium]MCL1968603.1 hypothetical protein [Bacteroidota bacterium]
MSINFSAKSQHLIVTQDTESRAETCIAPKVTDACVTFIARNNLELSFTSSVDKVVNVASKNNIGEYTEYNLTLPTDNLQYLDRILYVSCQLFPQSVSINLMLEAKESLRFYVYLSECYSIHYKNAINYLSQTAYQEAKEEFATAQKCFDAPSDGEVVAKIVIIDSILNLRTIAKEQFELLDYQASMETYTKILSYNPNDNYARQRYNECQQENDRLCDKIMTKAHKYFEEGDYEKAKILYNRVVKYNCYTKDPETRKILEKDLKDVEEFELKKKELLAVITYQWAINTPFGVSVGSYRDRKWGGYFTFLFNPDIFESFRGNFPTKRERPEIDAAFGATVRPSINKWTPIWIAFGLGYTAVGIQTNHDTYHAVSPEAGILVKIPFGKNPKAGLALRYTFQYRFSIDFTQQKYVKPVNNIVGLGFCF